MLGNGQWRSVKNFKYSMAICAVFHFLLFSGDWWPFNSKLRALGPKRP